MPSIFSRIIAGEIPGRFVWSDERCVAFLTAAPHTPGHTLVVPREEVDQWTQATPELFGHVCAVAQRIGVAQQEEWDAARIGLIIQGYEVPHLHLHVWPSFTGADFNPRNADTDPEPAAMDDAARRLRSRLRTHGHDAFVPAEP